MSKNRYFQKIYKFNEKSKTYQIEVSLDDYDDIYDDWDPSPFKKRDIEDEFNDFVVNSSEDIPLNYNISILLYLPQDKRNPNKEIALISAYRNFYDYAIERLNKSKTNLHKRTASSFFLSMLFLSIGYFFRSENSNLLLDVLNEGIFIGGWVFLWEFFTKMFITKREVQNEYMVYKRLYNSEILFVYQ